MSVALFSILVIFSPAVLIALGKPSKSPIALGLIFFWFAGLAFLVTDLLTRKPL